MNKDKVRVNYIDFVLTFVIIVIIISLLAIFFSANDSITVSLRLDNIQKNHKDLIKVNDTVYIGENETSLGVIKSVVYNEDENNKLTAFVEIEGVGTIDGSECRAGGEVFSENSIIDFRASEFSSNATVINYSKDIENEEE